MVNSWGIALGGGLSSVPPAVAAAAARGDEYGQRAQGEALHAARYYDTTCPHRPRQPSRTPVSSSGPQRQPSSGATWRSRLSMTWAL